MIRNWRSVFHATSNEDGNEELAIEYNQTFLDWILRRPGKKKVWVRIESLGWRDKDTAAPVSLDDFSIIMDMLDHFKLMEIYGHQEVTN